MPWERDVDLRVLAQHGGGAVDDGQPVAAKGTRDGAIFSADWYLKQLLRGRIFQAAGGATSQGFTDPGTFGAGTLDSDEFDLLVTVPLNTTIIPLAWTIQMEVYGTDQLFEILLAWGTGAVAAGTPLTLAAVNQNTGSARASALTIVANADDVGTVLTKQGEIYRDGLQNIDTVAADEAGLQPVRFEWKAGVPSDLFVIEGARFVAGWIAAQAGTGFQKFVWAEFETGEDIG